MKKLNFQILALLFTALVIGISSCREDDDPQQEPEPDEYTIVDDGTGTGTTTWKSGKTYFLQGFVFVNDGQILTIESRCVIKGKPGQGVVEGYAYGDELKDGHNNEIVYGESDQQNLERLISKEIDYFLVDALLIQYLLKYQLNDVSELLEISNHPLIVKSLHLAIRKDIPEAEQIIINFNDAVSTMMTDGSYNDILELNWVKADVDGDGTLELILAGNEAGTAEPEYSYNILYSEQDQVSGGYYVDGTKYNSWDDVPNQYKVDIPKVTAPADPNNSSMKIKF